MPWSAGAGRDRGLIPAEGHNQAFASFEVVPRTILYENTRIAVKQITGTGISISIISLSRASGGLETEC